MRRASRARRLPRPGRSPAGRSSRANARGRDLVVAGDHDGLDARAFWPCGSPRRPRAAADRSCGQAEERHAGLGRRAVVPACRRMARTRSASFAMARPVFRIGVAVRRNERARLRAVEDARALPENHFGRAPWRTRCARAVPVWTGRHAASFRTRTGSRRRAASPRRTRSTVASSLGREDGQGDLGGVAAAARPASSSLSLHRAPASRTARSVSSEGGRHVLPVAGEAAGRIVARAAHLQGAAACEDTAPRSCGPGSACRSCPSR